MDVMFFPFSVSVAAKGPVAVGLNSTTSVWDSLRASISAPVNGFVASLKISDPGDSLVMVASAFSRSAVPEFLITICVVLAVFTALLQHRSQFVGRTKRSAVPATARPVQNQALTSDQTQTAAEAKPARMAKSGIRHSATISAAFQ